MATASEFKDSLDHPVMFVVLISVAVICFTSILTWGAKAAGIPGLAALTQHP